MSHEIRLEPSGRTFSVMPDQAILPAGLAQGIRIPYGCRMGTCRTCRGRVVSGQVDLGNAHLAYLPREHRDAGYALLCQAKACSDLVIEIEEIPALPPPQRSPALVRRITRVTNTIALVALRLPLHANMYFAPGQYIDILLPDGARRSYSIANDCPTAGTIDIELHIRHLRGGLFTERVFGGLREREMLEFEGPLGTFFLRDSPKPALLLARGTGYAPIRSMLLGALARGDRRRFAVYWGARTRQDLYLLDEIADIAARHDNVTFVPVLSQSDTDWQGRAGDVQRAVIEDIADLSGWQVYAAGAPRMVDAARHELVVDRGLPEDEFHADAFVSMADIARLERA